MSITRLGQVWWTKETCDALLIAGVSLLMSLEFGRISIFVDGISFHFVRLIWKMEITSRTFTISCSAQLQYCMLDFQACNQVSQYYTIPSDLCACSPIDTAKDNALNC